MRLTHSIASSFDFTSHIQKPAISSFVSANGPSITVGFPPENLTRAPFELGWSPSPASMMPAFTSSSLKLPISVRSFSLGMTPASVFLSALMMIMNRIVVSPLVSSFGSRASGAFRPAVNPRSTKTSNEGRRNRQAGETFFAESSQSPGWDLATPPRWRRIRASRLQSPPPRAAI